MAPTWLGQWLALVSVAVAYVAFVLSYRVPAPFLPAWLRTEIQAGELPVARPDAGDWILFAFATAMAILALPAGIILIVAFNTR